MKVGDRVRLSAEGLAASWLFPDPDVRGTVVRPGVFRGGLRVSVLVDGRFRLGKAGAPRPRNFSARFWEVDE